MAHDDNGTAARKLILIGVKEPSQSGTSLQNIEVSPGNGPYEDLLTARILSKTDRPGFSRRCGHSGQRTGLPIPQILEQGIGERPVAFTIRRPVQVRQFGAIPDPRRFSEQDGIRQSENRCGPGNANRQRKNRGG